VTFGAGAPPGGNAVVLDGTNCVELPLGGDNPFDYTASSSITAWINVPASPDGALIFSSARDMEGDNHALALFLNDTGNLRVDMFWIATVEGDTAGLDDGTWHHVASVFDSTTGTTTLYVDGVEDGANEDIDGTIPNIAQDTIFIGATMNEEFPAEEGVEPLVGSVAHVGLFAEALDAAGVAEAMSEGFSCYGPTNPLAIDPNVMDVYETGWTEGDFGISLKFAPEGQGGDGNPDGTPISVNIIVDPNGFDGGGNADLTLIGGSGPHNRISFTRDAGNWSTPKIIRFKAVDDSEAEPPNLAEAQNIVVWAEPISTTEPNWARPVAEKTVGGTVWDNDQANILFTYSLPEKHAAYANVTGPVQLWEEPRVRYGTPYTRWRKIGITLQVPPHIDGDPCQPTTTVKLQAAVEGDVEGDNLPHTDPCLPFLEIEEPNGLYFTAGDYDIRQAIKIWGFDDAALQVLNEEGAYPSMEGQENYQAQLVVTVVDGGGDTRYEWLEEILTEEGESLNPPEFEMVGLERTVDINVEDNECGTFGVLSLDIGNPNAFTDPNYVDDEGNPLPDCSVDIWDAIVSALRFLNCTDPQTAGCDQLNLPPEE
jgi:hypothetical protein